MPKTILFSMAVDMAEKAIEPKDGVRYTSNEVEVNCPIIMFFAESKEALVERLTSMGEELWDAAEEAS